MGGRCRCYGGTRSDSYFRQPHGSERNCFGSGLAIRLQGRLDVCSWTIFQPSSNLLQISVNTPPGRLSLPAISSSQEPVTTARSPSSCSNARFEKERRPIFSRVG